LLKIGEKGGKPVRRGSGPAEEKDSIKTVEVCFCCRKWRLVLLESIKGKLENNFLALSTLKGGEKLKVMRPSSLKIEL